MGAATAWMSALVSMQLLCKVAVHTKMPMRLQWQALLATGLAFCCLRTQI